MDGKNDIKVLGNLVEDALGANFRALIMYGSCVYGEDDEFSDTDLCLVVGKRSVDTDNLIKDVVAEVQNRTYFLYVLGEDEFEENLQAGDFFYAHEVLGKGEIICENDGYASAARRKLHSTEPDFALAEKIHRERLEADKQGLRYHLEGALERLNWGLLDLAYLWLAKQHTRANGGENPLESIRADNRMSPYAGDLIRIHRLCKEYRHRRINFPVEKLVYFYKRFERMQKDVEG